MLNMNFNINGSTMHMHSPLDILYNDRDQIRELSSSVKDNYPWSNQVSKYKFTYKYLDVYSPYRQKANSRNKLLRNFDFGYNSSMDIFKANASYISNSWF